MSFFDTVWRVLLSGFFAMLPGMLFWLTVLALYMLIRWVGKILPFRDLGEHPGSA